VLDSDVTGCRVSIVLSSQNSWAKAPPHQSAETTGRAAETDNFLQSAGKELRLTPCPDAEVTLQSSNMAMGDPRRKLSFGWLETSSVSILTWVIFQKAMEPMTPDSKYEIIGYSTIFYYDTVGS